jgi:hypothetical protein
MKDCIPKMASTKIREDSIIGFRTSSLSPPIIVVPSTPMDVLALKSFGTNQLSNFWKFHTHGMKFLKIENLKGNLITTVVDYNIY